MPCNRAPFPLSKCVLGDEPLDTNPGVFYFGEKYLRHLTAIKLKRYNSLMKREQKRTLKQTFALYFERVALMAAAGLIFGQFIPDAEIDWRVVLGGMIISLGLITLAGLFREPKDDQQIIRI